MISEYTAEEIGRMMEMTVSEGTAASLDMTDSAAEPLAAAKTGTAEYESGGVSKTHAWITGYAPCDEPEYTITVFVENGDSGAERETGKDREGEEENRYTYSTLKDQAATACRLLPEQGMTRVFSILLREDAP